MNEQSVKDFNTRACRHLAVYLVPHQFLDWSGFLIHALHNQHLRPKQIRTLDVLILSEEEST